MASKLSICTSKNLPEKGTPGHFYFVKDARDGFQLLLAAANGTLCPVGDFFNIHISEAPGRDGVDGKDGLPGKDGVDGQSMKGEKGEPGDVLFIGPVELAAAMQVLRDRHALVLASIQNRIERLDNHHPAAKLAVLHLQGVRNELIKESK
jgi:hypothetical protein